MSKRDWLESPLTTEDRILTWLSEYEIKDKRIAFYTPNGQRYYQMPGKPNHIFIEMHEFPAKDPAQALHIQVDLNLDYIDAVVLKKEMLFLKLTQIENQLTVALDNRDTVDNHIKNAISQ